MDFSTEDLQKADFRKQDLAGANFSYCNLERAHFEGANLAVANFKNANLERAWFNDADLTGANLRGVNIQLALFTWKLTRRIEGGFLWLRESTKFHEHLLIYPEVVSLGRHVHHPDFFLSDDYGEYSRKWAIWANPDEVKRLIKQGLYELKREL